MREGPEAARGRPADAALWAMAHQRDAATQAELRLQAAVADGGLAALDEAIGAAERSARLSEASPALRKARALLAVLRPDSGAADAAATPPTPPPTPPTRHEAQLAAIFAQGYALPEEEEAAEEEEEEQDEG